jgi:hypothetical protein
MLKMNLKGSAIALLTVTTLAGTTLQVNPASAKRIPRVSPGVVQGAKLGAKIGQKAGQAAKQACEIRRQNHPNTRLCK